MILAADSDRSRKRASRVSILGWRPCQLKRKVPCTLAGEALSLSAAVAEVEYMQVLFRDVVLHDDDVPDCRSL
eukprot:3582025-Pyramimonas_sp.AAC.1